MWKSYKNMEATSCVKNLVLAANQYSHSKSDDCVVQLQRQLDVLISITHRGKSLNFFDPQQLLCTECLSCLVDMLNDDHTPDALSHKALILLSNLANEDKIREALRDQFHLMSCLAMFLKVRGTPTEQPAVQCVQLLQKVTYNAKISYAETCMEGLVQYLLKNVLTKESELRRPSLGVLANLCRLNLPIQTYIKNLGNFKAFCRNLVNNMSSSDHTLVSFSLAILTSLCLNEDLGERMFHARNIHQTFQLIFNILVHGDSVTARKYAVDLFIDLVKQAKIQQSLIIYEHLAACIQGSMSLLCGNDAETVSKMLELLLAFCSVTSIRSVVCRSLFESAELGQSLQYKHVASEPHRSVPFFAVLHWAAQSAESHNKIPSLALDFLQEMYECLIDLGLVPSVHLRLDLVLPLVSSTLTSHLSTSDARVVRKTLEKIVRALKLLLVLCADDSLRLELAKAVDLKTCICLLEYQVTSNCVGCKTAASASAQEWSESGVEVVLNTLDLMAQLKSLVPDMEAQLAKLLQDSKLVPFLAYGLSSQKREQVHRALRLLQCAFVMEEFPHIMLGDSIAANNTERAHDSMETSVQEPERQYSYRGHDPVDKENIYKPRLTEGSVNEPINSSLDSSVQILIEKMQSGLDMKDMRASEIINMYAHKLQSLQSKENQLQDLLDAKAMALDQADRLITEYRCRRAQSEAEARKLRQLLSESEQRCEELREQSRNLNSQHEKMHSDIEQLTKENTRLESIASEYTELTQAHVDQTQKLENVQRSLGTLKQEHQTMYEMHEMLRRHNETLKQQHDVALEQLMSLEDERKTLSRQLKEQNSKNQELSKKNQKQEAELKKEVKEREELEGAIDKLRGELGKTEQLKKDLQHQVTSLELVCRQHENNIKEKDAFINKYKSELEKHAQLTALIHNLSGGKTDVPIKK